MIIKKLIWNQEREEHIARHGVTKEEFDEIALGKHLASKAKYRRYRLIGQTENGRYLVLIVEEGEHGYFYPITARDVNDNERHFYKKHQKQ